VHNIFNLFQYNVSNLIDIRVSGHLQDNLIQFPYFPDEKTKLYKH
jgi:hypothetical protein